MSFLSDQFSVRCLPGPAEDYPGWSGTELVWSVTLGRSQEASSPPPFIYCRQSTEFFMALNRKESCLESATCLLRQMLFSRHFLYKY